MKLSQSEFLFATPTGSRLQGLYTSESDHDLAVVTKGGSGRSRNTQLQGEEALEFSSSIPQLRDNNMISDDLTVWSFKSLSFNAQCGSTSALEIMYSSLATKSSVDPYRFSFQPDLVKALNSAMSLTANNARTVAKIPKIANIQYLDS